MACYSKMPYFCKMEARDKLITMDQKIANYQEILKNLLSVYADRFNQNTKSVEAQVITDLERNHFQLLRLGWDNNRYTFSVVFHFDIKNGKIWLQENRTDTLIAKELVALGVPPNDIVLGLQAPEDRIYTEYAAA
jgi:hypothetical protein